MKKYFVCSIKPTGKYTSKPPIKIGLALPLQTDKLREKMDASDEQGLEKLVYFQLK
jgi:hypothetical protein